MINIRYIDVAGSKTRFLEAGDPQAPKLLLLHGMALMAEVWLANMNALARDHHVVAVDMLGHGFTEPAPGLSPTIPAKLEHLARFTKQIGFHEFAVNGSSFGALIGALLYLGGECWVSKLVITGSGSCFNTEEQFAAQVANKASLFHAETKGASMESWRDRLKFNFQNPDLLPEELPLLATHAYAQPWADDCWKTTVRTMADPDLFRPFRILERLGEIQIPTLVTWGRQDRGGSLESATAAVARMPNARIEVFDPCAHYPMIEHTEQYNELVASFLR